MRTSLFNQVIGLVTLFLACQHSIARAGAQRQHPPSEQTQQQNQITYGSGPFSGNATHFDGLGELAGGCGVPQHRLETQNFVALNVQHSPGDYSEGQSRPLPSHQSQIMGAFENGRNCGRWIRVTIGDYCTGNNNGAPHAGFCHSAGDSPWVTDQFNGATLDMIVADSCHDGNAWCRDDAHHLDLATASLTQFKKNGETMADLPSKWGNRRVHWEYIAAPNYSGDIKIGLARDAQRLWIPLVITHLENGIHGVEAWVDGRWQLGQMVSDNGQVFQLPGGAQAPYRIRVYDANDQLINQGRVYVFDWPSECGDRCLANYTGVTYRAE
ncbi:MAG: hypothetical protein FJ146_00645 [Deltaproteobacteria bacterium]|nr:hypothetical protein [Deltaproteobacteria bacterium]